MNIQIWTTAAIISITGAILILNTTSNTANAGSTCSASVQTHDKSVPPIHGGSMSFSSSNGSCSSSVSGRSGEDSLGGTSHHFSGAFAFNDPGFKTGTCTSSSAGPSGLSSDFNDGQHSNDRSCTTHSP
jgi:hypothetical protein